MLRSVRSGQELPPLEGDHRGYGHGRVSEEVLERRGRVRQGGSVGVPAFVGNHDNLFLFLPRDFGAIGTRSGHRREQNAGRFLRELPLSQYVSRCCCCCCYRRRGCSHGGLDSVTVVSGTRRCSGGARCCARSCACSPHAHLLVFRGQGYHGRVHGVGNVYSSTRRSRLLSCCC